MSDRMRFAAVLADSEALIAEAVVTMFAERYGVAVEAADFLPSIGGGAERCLVGIGEKYGLDVARKKPFPDIYIEAARRVGADPRRCLVVEDAVAGIAAAKAAGCACLALTASFGETDLRAAGADFVAPSLAAADRRLLAGRR